jgi:hypothetical protein
MSYFERWELMPVFDYNVPGEVPRIKQPNDVTCWAAAATMLISWMEKKSYPIQDVVDRAGSAFRAIFDVPRPINLETESEAFITSLGFHSEPPAEYTPEGLLNIMKMWGPLWVYTNENPGNIFSGHARIIVGMFGDYSYDNTIIKVIDPSDGCFYEEYFNDFTEKFEKFGGSPPLIIQIIHN